MEPSRVEPPGAASVVSGSDDVPRMSQPCDTACPSQDAAQEISQRALEELTGMKLAAKHEWLVWGDRLFHRATDKAWVEYPERS